MYPYDSVLNRYRGVTRRTNDDDDDDDDDGASPTGEDARRAFCSLRGR